MTSRKLGIQVPLLPDGIDHTLDYIKRIRATGFDAIFTPSLNDYQKELTAMLKTARDEGLEIDELHAPFKNINRMWYDEPIGDPVQKMMMDSVDICAAQGVEKMVMHECANRIGPDMSNAGLKRFREIFLYAKEKGVKIAVENLRRTNSLARILFLNRDLDNVGYCWDCGHELCYTPGVDHLAIFGDKVLCTHIHDNQGVYMGDDHVLPFDGKTDWEKKARLIKKCGYNGIMMMEVTRKGYEDLSDDAWLKEAYSRILRFAEMCDNA